MKDLPTTNTKEAWPLVRLEDVCEFRRGLTYSKSDESELSSNVVLRSNNISLESGKLDFAELKHLRETFVIPSDKKVVQNAILMCMANGSKPHLGKVAIIDKDYGYAFGGFMGLLVPKDVEPRYLYLALTSSQFKNRIKSLQDGANINNLKFTDIADFQFPLPPLSVQRAIVARLEKGLGEADKLAAKFKRIAQLADDEFKAELDETFKQVKGEKVRLGDVCETITSRGHQIMQQDILEHGKFPVVSQSDNLIEGYTDKAIAIDNIPLVLFGDHTCCVKLIDFPFVVGADGTKLVQLPNNNCRYLFYVIQCISPNICDGKYRRHFADLMQTIIPLPSLATQRAIVAKLDAVKERCEKLKAAAERGLRETENLRKSILAEAFEQ